MRSRRFRDEQEAAGFAEIKCMAFKRRTAIPRRTCCFQCATRPTIAAVKARVAAPRRRSQPGQQLRLLGREFLVAQNSLAVEIGELLDRAQNVDLGA